jgi:putative peptide zinc metalloprotease protein
MYEPSTQVAVYPFTRQPDGEEIVIGRTDTGIFLSLPREAVEILDWLRDGRTVAEAQAQYQEKYGEIPDVADLLTFLQEKGFVRPRRDGTSADAPVSAANAANAVITPAADKTFAPPAAAAVRYHFANIPVPLARKLFGKTALALGALIFALAVVAVFLDPSLRPHRDALIFSQHRTLKTLALILIGYTTVFVHEMGHLMAARAVGVNSRLGISSRMWVLVAETDMTGLWSVPKNQRYLPMLAGPVIDVVSASLISLMLFAQHRGWIALPALVVQLSMAMVFVYMMRLLWQCFFFVRTDFYFVIATFFGCKSLMQDTRVYIGNLRRRLFGSATPLTDQSHIPKTERRVISAYAWIWFLGRAVALWSLFFVTLPVAGKYLKSSIATMMTGFSGGTYAFFDALFILVFYLFPLGLGMSLWIRGILRQRREPREREREQTVFST